MGEPPMYGGNGNFCVVMVCADVGQAELVGRQLSKLNNGCLITYRRAEDLFANRPTTRVALMILALDQKPAHMGWTLSWLRHRWPNCPIVVVGSDGGRQEELAARTGGAIFLTRPVPAEQWLDILQHNMPAVAQAQTQPSQR
jgi:FixJ family two-component response regulator